MSGQAVRTELLPEGDTKRRILDAAEALFVAHGADGMSLRAVTGSAGVNIAAVNYHFGNKDRLVEALLRSRLDPLNDQRSRMLDACERRWPGRALSCDEVLGAMFAPALCLARQGAGDALHGVRFFGRAYSDPSPITTTFVHERYEAIHARFVDAFARALPHLPRPDLRLRLSVVLKAVAGFVAGPELPELLAAFGRGGVSQAVRDRRLLGSLGSLMSGALTAPPRGEDGAFSVIIAMAESLQASGPASGPAREGST